MIRKTFTALVLLAAALLGCASRHGFQTKEEADHFMVSAIIRADPTPEHMASFRGKYRSIRGMGGNGPFFVFLIRGQQMFLAYRNQFDEKVNRVVLHEGDNGSVMLHTYAHIGLSSGPQKPTVHEMRRGKLAFEYRGIGN
ncbi:MAG: hypothetical protein ACYS0H_30215 [Planctomycetota bacterium]|jgi:hypothetical protein